MKKFLSQSYILRRTQVLIILLAVLALNSPAQKAADAKPKLSVEDIVKQLSVKKVSAAQKNTLLIKKVEQQGIDFIIDDKIAARLKSSGANAQLLKLLYKKSADIYFDRGYACKNDDNDCQITNYSEAIKLYPKKADSYYNRALAYQGKGDYEKSIADGTKAIELDPKIAVYYINRGISYFDNGDFESSIKDYTKAIELQPDDGDGYYNRGISYYELADYANALKDYTKAIELNAEDSDAYYNRNLVYTMLGDEEKAEADLRKSEEIKKKIKP